MLKWALTCLDQMILEMLQKPPAAGGCLHYVHPGSCRMYFFCSCLTGPHLTNTSGCWTTCFSLDFALSPSWKLQFPPTAAPSCWCTCCRLSTAAGLVHTSLTLQDPEAGLSAIWDLRYLHQMWSKYIRTHSRPDFVLSLRLHPLHAASASSPPSYLASAPGFAPFTHLPRFSHQRC